ncbi:uncharacterized protein LOC106876622 [Octopus bimaculoides]|uniref:Apple domain-containing protein n=1 Tax=Octopus bimaculoides TaxID=37653 RepID=A0A0L8GIT7_OCTBM|nr:uncharacterized protein LOC106876622 [Octopus bimaculoides]|eukprot:XP_014780723.1 PREDICTED: uncharacterized protein LOC106876622 [Octopus bimaculoides]
MNLKGMKTSNQPRMILSRLQVFTIIFIAILRTGTSNDDGQLFRKTTESKCLKLPIVRTGYTSSVTECALQCMMNEECGYFSYCDGLCKMYELFSTEDIQDYSCSCLSYVRFSGNSTSWQKVFEINEISFKRSPIYKYWDSLPIEKVKLTLRKNKADVHSLTFDGKETNYTSWFQYEKLISVPWFGDVKVNYEFKYAEEIIAIGPVNNDNYGALKAGKTNSLHYYIRYREDFTVENSKAPLEALDIYALLK